MLAFWRVTRAFCRTALLLYAALIAAQAFAMTVNLTIAEQSARSQFVLQGEVVRAASAWNETRTAIYTDITMRVVQVLVARSAAPSEVVFRIEGGEVGNMGMGASDSPSFRVGEQAIVFLMPGDGAQAFSLVAEDESVFHVIDGRAVKGDLALPLEQFKTQILQSVR
jgi:hypothetical protein